MNWMYKCRLVPWPSYGKSNEDVQKNTQFIYPVTKWEP